MEKTLKDLKIGEKGIVAKLMGSGAIKGKMLAMGILPGAEIMVNAVAPFGDPVEVSIRGYKLSLRSLEAETIIMK
ncbi:Fe2+ transport system protein FeoA [Anaerosolibacter carboniphilus]|uniref:Fe2+ transport system protein FeoA n=1 Tax=Anaerosolibacter carboniphilus TaxID=1417629 RepID=A0A841L5A5_9FIRM|nr:Fe2+ transport system protein FeoA [Anaerosolibacter carboniphilus]